MSVHASEQILGKTAVGAARVGIGGPVGSGKTALIERLIPALAARGVSLAIVTNDLVTAEDAERIRRSGLIDPARVAAVEAGACPHTVIREDPTLNIAAADDLEMLFPDVELVLIESGGDNLASTFSLDLVDWWMFVIDVAGGDDIPAKRPRRAEMRPACGQQEGSRAVCRCRSRPDDGGSDNGTVRQADRADQLPDRRWRRRDCRAHCQGAFVSMMQHWRSDPDMRNAPALGTRHGRFDLEFRYDGKRGLIGRQFVSYPFHFTRPFALDREIPSLLTVYQQSSSGGLYRADRLTSHVEMRPGAGAHITTQAATVVHDCQGLAASQTVRIVAEAGSFSPIPPTR